MNTRQRVETCFTLQKMAQDTQDVYHQFLK